MSVTVSLRHPLYMHMDEIAHLVPRDERDWAQALLFVESDHSCLARSGLRADAALAMRG